MKILVHRPVRRSTPVLPAPERPMAPPPQLPTAPAGGVPVQTLLPVLGAVSSMVMMTLSRGSSPVFLVVGVLVFVVALVSGLVMAFTQRAKATRTRQLSRERYLDYLEDLRAEMRDKAQAVRTAALVTDPAPVVLPQIIADPARVWERRPGQADYLRVRVGTGNVTWFDLSAPVEQNPVQPLDPLMLDESVQACQIHDVIEDMPLWLDVGRGGDVAIIGTAEVTANAARTLVAQVACLHSPADVRIGTVFPPAAAAQWPGVGLLPHAYASTTSAGVPRALVATTVADLATMLTADLTSRIRRVAAQRHASTTDAAPVELPHLLIVVDEHGGTASTFPIPEEGYSCADLNITVVHLVGDRLDEPSALNTRVTIEDDQIAIEDLSGPSDVARTDTGRPDAMSPALFEAIAQDLAPLTLAVAEAQQSAAAPETISAMKLLGVSDLDLLTPEIAWQPRSSRDFLRIPIGVDDHGAPLLLDLKESAQLGMGPHGICIGATGSGKSELLRTLVLSLALTHSPEDLSMILVDYKGGAAFAPFAQLAHVAGLMDNLADDPQLTRRARESIAGEVQRRQEMLKQAGSIASITHYRALREENPTLPAMPHLFLVIDEFGELLTAEPEFSDLLLKIGRIGRSIGVHLLLASQRIEGGMLHGLDTYLSYWIGMRTFSEAESRTILNTVDAFTLPAVPGYGYLKVDTSVYTRFKAGYVSGPVLDATDTADSEDAARQAALVQAVPDFAAPDQADTLIAEEELAPPDIGHLLVDEAVARLATPLVTSPVWLPPLPVRITLGAIITDTIRAEAGRTMAVPVGLLDDPGHQQQQPWMLDLALRGGHLAIIGAPQSGRSTFLRTIAASLALTHTPKQVSIYGIDLTGGGLDRIEGFPHVGGVATRSDKPKLSRLFEELHAMINQRETIFRNYHIDSPSALRVAHAKGLIRELVAPDVVILVDGVDPIRNEFSELDESFTELVQRGGAFGIHIIAALTRWNEVRAALQPLFGQKFELRLNDPSESIIQRAAAQALKASSPGRVLTQDLLYGQIALPVLDEVDDDTTIGDELAALAQRSAESWSGPSAAPIRLLPDNLDPADLPDEFDDPDQVPFGIGQDTFQTAYFDPATDLHLLVFGDTKCGKTTLLRGLAHQLVKRRTPDELVFAVIDPRNSLAGSIPEDYLGGKAATANDALALSTAIAAELDKRKAQTGASYPQVVVLVDDYDIIAAGGTQPLQPLIAYLPSARDLHLSVIMTRPVTGAARGLFDPAIQAIRDTGGSGLIMNGERSEGAIFPKVYPEQFPPGRGKFVRRGTRPRIVQVANFAQEGTHAS
ncbi:MAG: type VII secretion protein EccCa [Propionibacteriaceae bacterium]|nr:type VII secretion protein EccCa [Propionibacteriaceae bacterium]